MFGVVAWLDRAIVKDEENSDTDYAIEGVVMTMHECSLLCFLHNILRYHLRIRFCDSKDLRTQYGRPPKSLFYNNFHML